MENQNKKVNFLDKSLFGSRLYGTNTDKSDWDYICVVAEYPKEGNLIEDGNNTYHLYNTFDYQKAMDNHDVAILESMYLNNKVPSYFMLDKGKLRKSFSTVSNHSWNKGKKKLTVHFDYDKYAGIKSIFHSIRITDYGIQLASQGRIYNKSEYNYVLDDLLDLSDKYERDELWNKIESRYKGLWKDLRSVFKGLCPKSNMSSFKEKDKLISVLYKHKVKVNKEIIKDIKEVFE